MILLGATQALSTERVPGANFIYNKTSLRRGHIPFGLTMKSHKTGA